MLKLLVIAPYPDLKRRFDLIKNNYKNLSIKCMVGDLEVGVKIAQQQGSKFDLLISRGGTAQEIKQAIDKPLVEVPISSLDILRVIKLLSAFQKKYVFVAYSNITAKIKIIAEVLNKKLDIVTIKNRNDLPLLFKTLKQKKYELVVGDHIATKFAYKFNINSIMLESGEESVKACLLEATYWGRQIQNNAIQIPQILDSLNFSILRFIGGQLVFKHLNSKQSKLLPIVQYHVKQFEKEKKSAIIINIRQQENNYQLLLKKTGTVINAAIVNNYFDPINQLVIQDLSHHNVNHVLSTNLLGIKQTELKAALKTKNNILISGPEGTGKEAILRFLANQNHFHNKYLIDCSKVNSHSKAWHQLFSSISSPLLVTDSAFFIRGLDYLDNNQLKQLMSYIDNTTPDSYQWIVTCNLDKPKNPKVISLVQDHFNSYVIHIPPLNQRKEELSSIITLSIDQANRANNTNVIGVEPQGLQELINYSWPFNLRQLKRVITQLVINAQGAFISTQAVNEAIEIEINETHSLRLSDLSGKTLDEINQLVIKERLAANNNNKAKTARDLGISRSTLWRYLEK